METGRYVPSIQSWEDDYKWVKENLPTLKEHEGTLGARAANLFRGLNTYTGIMEKVRSSMYTPI